MSDADRLLSIGTFGRRARLSPKALRLYARAGLLVPRLRTSLLSGTSPAPAEAFGVRERDVPAQLVLTEQRSLRITELKGWLPEALSRLAATPASHGDVFVIYHGEVNEDSDGPVEVCAPVTREARLPPGSAVRLEPAHGEAYVRISRAQLEFPQILSAFDAVGQWIAGAGRCQAGPPREVYLRGADVATAAPGDPVCDVAFPVAPLR